MTTQDGRECPSEGAIVETSLEGLDNDLVADQCQTNFAALLHVHGRGEVPGEEHAQAPADPLHAPSEGHTGSIMCV